ncbi:hypothetical protein PR048_005476 [Dryococelus australis]|uniref:Uncharacterized protein n=1 Tax=Dryococelus australis TaxID=614101 RepID=A0ABQ9I8C6_9NEOP|nr:hypothetical protein PR048_005476 [Dryococelus australis]
MQHPTLDNSGHTREATLQPECTKSQKVATFPVSYSIVLPCFISLQTSGNQMAEPEELILPHPESAPNIKEYKWLEQILNIGKRLNWAAYHSSFNRLIRKLITTMLMLPLFLESSNSPAMMLHSVNVVTECVKYLDPNQTSVLVGDQPPFTLMKQIQYYLREEHGEDKFVEMMGELHIEKATLRKAERWLEGNEWVEMITQSEITTKEKAEDPLKVSHIKKARHIHEVTAALFFLQNRAFAEYRGSGNPFGVTDEDLHHLHDHVVMSDKVATSIMALEKEGQEQFQEFVMKQLVSAEKEIMDPIKCNEISTFKRPALQNHIHTLLPPSEPSDNAKIFDGATFIHMIKPGDGQTFQEYIDNKYLPYMEKRKNSVQCIDVVWDVYKSDSLKQGTRMKRGSGLRIGGALNNITIGSANNEVYSALGSTVIRSSDIMDIESMSPYNHEEVDRRIFLHAADAAKRGLPRVFIRATDTDVVIIGVSMYRVMGLEEPWLSFGSGKNL